MKKEYEKILLIDGNAIIHRSYHALPLLTTKKGELVNAVYGFSSTLLSVVDRFKPEYILVSFDLAGPTFRHREYKEYKATRIKAPDELYAQIERVKDVVRAFNIPIYEKSGFEADDVIGTAVKQVEEKYPDIEKIIVTGDLDTLQLVGEKTKVFTLKKGISDTVIYDVEKIKDKYGLIPEQIVDFKGLRGDPSDNIPGVKGIGEKTASMLLRQYGSVEGVYAHLSEIKNGVAEKLEKEKTQALLSKKLATIFQAVPIKIELEKCKTNDFNREKATSLFSELNFYSLIKRFPDNQSNRLDKLKNIGVADFKFKEIDQKDGASFFYEMERQKEIGIYLDVSGERSALRAMVFIWKNGRAGYVKNLIWSFEFLRKILANREILKIGYNLKADIKILKKNDIFLEDEMYDVLLAAYMLNPGEKLNLESLVLKELGDEMIEKKNNGQLALNLESEKEFLEKICRRADYVFKLKKILEEKIKKISAEQGKNNIQKVFQEVEMKLSRVLAELENNGIKFNKLIFQGVSQKIAGKIKDLEKRIYFLAGENFNINSPKQLRSILFDKLKISVADLKKTKTGFSTASSELQKIKNKHQIAGLIEEYRELFKLKNTYLDVLPNLVDENSRLHTSFNQAVTATGRLSSSDPNLQNIPIRTDLGQLLRTAFEAENGWKLISIDYSQIDLRVVAHVSGDKKMIETFWRNEDIHRTTAAEINKVTISKVTDKMRRAAKALNFGIIYGMSVFGFSESSGINRDEAKKFMEMYLQKFSGVAEYMNKTREFVKKFGYVETEIGRRRYVPEINSPNFQLAAAGERMAINMPIQGLAADIMKLAMIKVYAEYEKNPNVKIVLQVHDEIILEVKEEIVSQVSRKVKEIMENVYKLKVPLVAEVKIGDNWGEI